jgi:hypothetical protein
LGKEGKGSSELKEELEKGKLGKFDFQEREMLQEGRKELSLEGCY